MKPGEIVAKLLRELLKAEGAGGINDAAKQFAKDCGNVGVGTATTTLLGTGLPGALPFLGLVTLIVGPMLWEGRGEKKQQKAIGEAIGGVLEAVEAAGSSATAAAQGTMRLEALLEQIVDHKLSVWARLNAVDKQDIAERVTAETKKMLDTMLRTLGKEHPELLQALHRIENIAVFVETNHYRICLLEKKMDAGFERIEVKLSEIADMQEKLLKASAANTMLALANAQMSQENASLHRQLMDANRALAEARLSEGRSVDEVLTELRSTDPRELFQFLVGTVDDAEDEYRQQQQKLIEHHRGIAEIGFPLGKIDEAERSLRRILEIRPYDLNAHSRLGHIHLLRGEPSKAAPHFVIALEVTDDKQAHASAYCSLGMVQHMLGALDDAALSLQRALSIGEALGRKDTMAAALGNLSGVEMARENLDVAEKHMKRALSIYEDLDSKVGIATQLGNLGGLEMFRGNLDEALSYLNRSRKLVEDLGHKEGVSGVLSNLGLVELSRGNPDEAEASFTRSLLIDEELGNKEGMAKSLASLGFIEQHRGNLETACGYLRRALDLFKDIGSDPQVQQTQAMLDKAGCGEP